MYVSRRRFILVTSLIGLWLKCGRLLAAKNEPRDGTELGLGAWVDTLFPADERSPSGSALGVQAQILEKAAAIAPYQELLSAGVRWANAQAVACGAESFTALSLEAREAVVAEAEAMGIRKMPRLFFYHTLKDARSFYYGQAGGWSAVGFPHTPQPLGFVDYMEAPK